MDCISKASSQHKTFVLEIAIGSIEVLCTLCACVIIELLIILVHLIDGQGERNPEFATSVWHYYPVSSEVP